MIFQNFTLVLASSLLQAPIWHTTWPPLSEKTFDVRSRSNSCQIFIYDTIVGHEWSSEVIHVRPWTATQATWTSHLNPEYKVLDGDVTSRFFAAVEHCNVVAFDAPSRDYQTSGIRARFDFTGNEIEFLGWIKDA